MQIANSFLRQGQVDCTRLGNASSIILDLACRRRSRQLLTLDDGRQLGLALPRGTVLRDGDVLVTDAAEYILVRAAEEAVLRVTADSPTALARAAYHLGNRHVLLEIGEGYLQLEYDPVLADMLVQLGGVRAEQLQAPFEPDVGAYGGGHRHGHDDSFAEDYALAQSAFEAHSHHDHDHDHD
ncbi:MAG: urease accessory protein UreE, partial [Pseudomonas sp.]